jgi:hypothetical protein
MSKPAFVEVTYMDDSASFASAGWITGPLPRAEVIEVKAQTQAEAENVARERIRANPMAGGVQARFLRWGSS